jgi:PAS domain S-box-containing protein
MTEPTTPSGPDPDARAPAPPQPPLASVEWDAEGRVVRWSPEAEALFGWRADEVRGRRSADWPFVHPDDVPQVRRVASDLVEGRAPQTFSANRNLTRDGRVLHCEWYNTAVIDSRGRMLGQLSLVLDVSERVRAEQRAEHAAGRTRRLQAITEALSEALTPAQVANVVMDQGIGALEADAGVLVLVTPDGGHLEVLASRGYPPARVEAWRRFPLAAEVPIAQATRTGEVEIVHSLEERSARYPILAQAEGDHPMSVSVPLVVEGERVGAMGLSFAQPREFGDEDRSFVLALGRQCAQAVRRAGLYEAERRARAAAERAEAELSQVFEQAPVAICVLRGPEHVYEMVNPVYRGQLGPRDPVGRTVRQVLPELEEQGVVALLDQVYRTGQAFRAGEFRVTYDRAGDGRPEERFFNLVYHPLVDDGGAVRGVVTVSTEVTAQVRARRALEESERQFRTLAESIPQLAWMADETGSISWYNQRWYDYTGTTPEQMHGWGWRAVHHPDAVARVEARYRRAVEAGEPWEDTFPLRGADGAYRRFLSRALPVRDDAGRIVRWFGTNTDVEETLRAQEARTQALAEAQAARTQAEEASRAKSVFLATMSHEIRTPINAVIGYADLLDMGLQGPLNDGQSGYLDRIRASSQHLLGLVNDVLDFAKIEAGQMGVVRERVSLRDAAADALAMVLPQGAARGIELGEVPCDPDAAYVGAPDRVRQILLNLLSNAIKFTRPGGRVTVRCWGDAEPLPGVHPPQPGPYACIEVEDTGIGIAPEHLARVFEPFTQVDETHTRETGGTGLGLAISRRFARLMGGELSARSRPGHGSVFTLWLTSAATEANAPRTELDWPSTAGQIAGLAQAAHALEAHVEAVVDAWVRRVWADPGIPHAQALERPLVEDHTSTFVTEIARALVMLDASGGEPELMRDGESIQRTVASLHGAQRARLGFTAEEIGREYGLLGDTVEEVLRREALEPEGVDPRPVLALVRRLLDRATRIAQEAHASVPDGERLLAETQRVIDRTARTVRHARREMERGREE